MSATKLADEAEREQTEPVDEATELDTQPDTEPDNGDDDENGDNGDQEQPAPAEPPSERQLEEAFRKLDAEAARHGKRVAEIMGDDFGELDNCPCCQIAGYVFPFMPGTEQDEERRAAVLAYLGQGEPDYPEAPDTDACDECDATGRVKTRSRNPEHLTKLCRKCGGTGFVAKLEQPAAVPQLAAVSAGAGFGQTAAASDAGPDLWGRPAGHHDYGVVPALVNAPNV